MTYVVFIVIIFNCIFFISSPITGSWSTIYRVNLYTRGVLIKTDSTDTNVISEQATVALNLGLLERYKN